LPRGTYCKFNAKNYLAENYVADAMTPDDENTQEELAS